MMTRTIPGLLIATALLATLSSPVLADSDPNLVSYKADMQTGDKSWRAQKCAVYEETRTEMLEEFPRGTLRSSFAKAEENYIANGCAGRAYACPETKTELKYDCRGPSCPMAANPASNNPLGSNHKPLRCEVGRPDLCGYAEQNRRKIYIFQGFATKEPMQIRATGAVM